MSRFPGNGGWRYTEWSECSATCGHSGVRTRTAIACDEPTPMYGGMYCAFSKKLEYGTCNRFRCTGINIRPIRFSLVESANTSQLGWGRVGRGRAGQGRARPIQIPVYTFRKLLNDHVPLVQLTFFKFLDNSQTVVFSAC